jgi:lysophospholipase L1-like esterase
MMHSAPVLSCFVFLLASSVTLTGHAQQRSHFEHSRSAFTGRRAGTVAFIGGSITELDQRGHTGMIEKFLQTRFPDTKFKFVNAGISSTCSTTGAFRLSRDVLAHRPDLLFIEFAVNDDQDGQHNRRDCIRGLEGIIRQARLQNPKLDMLVTYFPNDAMLAQLKNGQTPDVIAAHESVARHYGVASVNLAEQLFARIQAGEMTWEQYGGTHPVTAGNRFAADLIQDLLSAAWSNPEGDRPDHKLPKPLDPNSYFRGRLIDLESAQRGPGWTIGKPQWSQIPGALRPRFATDRLLFTSTVGDETVLDFAGTAIGLYVLAGPDAGTVEYSVDGSPFESVDLYHRFSAGLHYPRTVMLNADLPVGKHRLVLRVAATKHAESTGHAVRILNLVAN